MPLEALRVPERDRWPTLINAWGGLLDGYEEIARDDFAYWHGENSLTASLAAAAWLANNSATLVEFETKRIRRIREQSGSGAGDAYLALARTGTPLRRSCAGTRTRLSIIWRRLAATFDTLRATL